MSDYEPLARRLELLHPIRCQQPCEICEAATALRALMAEGSRDFQLTRLREQYEARCQAAERDARRYRWLFDNAYVFGSSVYVAVLPNEPISMWLLGSAPMDRRGVDEAIDAAIDTAAEPSKGKADG